MVHAKEKVDTKQLREMVEESLVLAMEHREREKLCRGLRPQ
jgi:hypothetical protein